MTSQPPLQDERCYGKYRGLVSDNEDPRGQGRLRARVPELLGDLETGWALPCVPYAGDGVGFYTIPPRGAGVWIEFEAGDPSRPIWSGAWWGKDDGLDELGRPLARALVTSRGHKIVLDDDSDLILLEHSGGAKVEIGSAEIAVQAGAGKIVLSGSGVNVNNGALTVK